MTNIVKLNSATAIDPLTPARSRPAWLGWSKNGIEKTATDLTIFSDRVPSPDRMRALRQRRDKLASFLRAGGDNEAVELLAVMLASMPHAAGSELDAKARGMGYTVALQDAPGWALKRVCRNVLVGAYPEHSRFAPTPPEMRGLVERLTAPIVAEIDECDLILNARVIAPPPVRTPPKGSLTWAEAEEAKQSRKMEGPGWLTPDIVADLAARKAKREEREGGAQ